MSSDYMIAIEEGATMVRVGSAIFGRGSTESAGLWKKTHHSNIGEEEE
jgi:hypothetical protein